MLLGILSMTCPHCDSADVHHAYSKSDRDFYVCECCNGMFFLRMGYDGNNRCLQKHSIDHYAGGMLGFPEYKPEYK